MPCTMSKEEEEYYERYHNMGLYGEGWTNAQLTEAVACALAKELEAAGLLSKMPGYVQGWIEAHKRRDAERS